MKKDILYILTLTFFLVLSLIGTIWAESNGVWIESKDIRGGTFGSDEQGSTSDFTFINPVDFNSEVEMDTAKVKTIKSNSANGNVVVELG